MEHPLSASELMSTKPLVPSAAPLGPSRYLPSKALEMVAAVSHTE